jgi:UDP-N-acetylglucosamine--N-acetylmuramyl-(pentapeptide) pyrophosphoryl-undecaprenol N-acetylglucosamine transferase
VKDGGEGTYVIAAGKTGGHIYPGIALAREIRARRPEAPILFVGTAGGLEERLVPEAGFALERVAASGFVGKSAWNRVRALGRLPIGFFQARRLLLRHRARAVAGMGGYVIVPVLAAARSLGVPTLVHDSDSLPGISSRIASRFATRAAVGVPRAAGRLGGSAVVTGTPVRSEFYAIEPLEASRGHRRLLVYGGSQGAAILNHTLARAVPLLAAEGLEVVHQVGDRHLETTREAYGAVPSGWRLERFLPRLYEELSWSHLAVARAGAMTLAELAAAGRPSILVPFESAAHGHQLANARVFEEAGAAVVIEEKDLSADSLASAVLRLLGDPTTLAEMGRRARCLAVPDAAVRLADLLFEAERERNA